MALCSQLRAIPSFSFQNPRPSSVQHLRLQKKLKIVHTANAFRIGFNLRIAWLGENVNFMCCGNQSMMLAARTSSMHNRWHSDRRVVPGIVHPRQIVQHTDDVRTTKFNQIPHKFQRRLFYDKLFCWLSFFSVTVSQHFGAFFALDILFICICTFSYSLCTQRAFNSFKRTLHPMSVSLYSVYLRKIFSTQ